MAQYKRAAGSTGPSPTRLSRTLAVLALASGLALPRWAAAQDTTKADETFHAGRELMKDGKFADACPKFEESQKLDPGLGTQFNLADCQEHLGKLASAWANFGDAASRAKAAGQAERAQAAKERGTRWRRASSSSSSWRRIRRARSS